MTYDWEGNAEGTGQTPKLPNGVHDLEITRVIFTDRDGTALSSRGGDPKIGIIFADDQGREGSDWVTLSDKAGFVLARILSKAGVDMAKMNADGVVPADFAEREFAEPNLIGRRLRAEVTWGKDGKGKDVCEIVPIGPAGEDMPAATAIEVDIPI